MLKASNWWTAEKTGTWDVGNQFHETNFNCNYFNATASRAWTTLSLSLSLSPNPCFPPSRHTVPLVKIDIETKGVSRDKGVHSVINVATIVYRACRTPNAFVYSKLLMVTWENRTLIMPHFVNYGAGLLENWYFTLDACFMIKQCEYAALK